MWKIFCHAFLFIQTFCIIKAWTQCAGEFKANNCVYNLQCTDDVYLPQYSEIFEVHPNCNNYVYSDRMYVPITIVYKGTTDSEYKILDWRFDNSDMSNAIISIDLSYNKYIFLPSLPSLMKNLKFLNISHNNLIDVVFHSEINYPILSEIDFSYNMINDIDFFNNLSFSEKLETLDLSHNAINFIPDAVFQNFGRLVFLNLSYNHLITLSALSFEGLKNLRSLHLEYNDIIDINSSLLRFINLQELHLKHNRMVKIQRRDFHNLYNLRKIDLSSNKILDIERPTFQNMSLLEELDLSDNALEVVYKEYFNDSNNLHIVDLSANRLKNLPAELFKEKKMSLFSIKDNILQGHLITGMFLGLRNVTILNISNQYLTYVEDNAFIGLESLKTLLLNNNKIKSVSKNAFTSLTNVKHIDLSNNFIATLDFEKKYLLNLQLLSVKNNFIPYIKIDTFINLNRLESIDLSNNNITEIDNNSFKPLKLVTDFHISNNTLNTAIDPDIFDGLTLIPNIDLSFSKISLVKNNTFQCMSRLTCLNISHSLLNELQFNSFAHIRNIATIDMSFNRLASFIVNTTDLINLSSLILHNNLLTVIPTMTLKGIPNLIKVNFSYNKLQTISTTAFADQKSMSELDVSFNPSLNLNFTNFINFANLRTLKLSGTIININFKLINDNHLTQLELSHAKIKNVSSLWLCSFEHLEVLTLNNNEIASIDKNAFARNIHLQRLDLSFNIIKYIQPGAFKNNRYLQTLIISHNYLTNVNYGTFRGLIGLNILDLSYNRIESLDDLYWQEIENLNTLIIDENRINDLKYFLRTNTNLFELSIGDNPIECRLIHELKQHLNFKITTLKKDEHSDNIDGIVCNKNSSLFEDDRSTGKTEESKNIIAMLKSILLNSTVLNTSDKRSENEDKELLANVTDVFQKSSGDILKQLSVLNENAYSISRNNNQTNSLLDRLLKVVVIMNSAIRSPRPPLSDNVTRDNLTLYINKVKQELEDDMAIQRESILADLDSKISMANYRKKLVQNEEALKDAKPSTSNSSFVDICVILILIIAVCFVVFKLWKWFNGTPRIWQNSSLSRQHITESLENSQL